MTKYSVMVTSLYGGSSRNEVDYYFTSDGKRRLYCDAMLAAEASSKYILANHHIDEIITLGNNTSYDPGDELVQIVLKEGSSFYTSDPNSLSAYSLLRYRLAQYIDEIRIEGQDLRDILNEEEQDKTKDYLRKFFRENIQPRGTVKLNKYFDILIQDKELRSMFVNGLIEAIPEAAADSARYGKWITNYLYEDLKDTSKLELLEGNEAVKIRFIPTDGADSLYFSNKLSEHFRKLEEEAEGDFELELYICIQSEDAYDTVALMNFMEIIKSMPGSKTVIKKIATGTRSVDGALNEISDDTKFYGVRDLLTGMRAFLRYGKTDLLMEYWKKSQIDNDYIDRVLYAMRNIDYGISLCDIGDIERGINSLRKLFKESNYKFGNSIVEQYFGMVIEAIKQDYGMLVTGDKIEFLDLVKWAYRKGFWQQTLTIIESRAPDDMVERGIYFYADSEKAKEKALSVFAGIYNDLKPFEKYKLDHIEHYFIKFYGRDRADRAPDSDGRQQKYVRLRMADLDTGDPEIIRAFTVCPDREALGNLLYSYYMVGIVRNETNHARNDDFNEFGSKPTDADVSERVNTIKRSVEEFITRYELMLDLVKDKDPNVVYITNSEIRAFANVIKPRFGGKDFKDRKPEKNAEEGSEKPEKKEEAGGKPEEKNAENTKE